MRARTANRYHRPHIPRPGAGDYIRPADEGEPARGGRAKDKKRPKSLRYPLRFVRAIELRGMARDDKSIPHRSSCRIPISFSSRSPSRRPVSFSLSIVSLSRLVLRLVIASRLFSSLFSSVSSSYPSSLIPVGSSNRLITIIVAILRCPHIVLSPYCVILPYRLIPISPPAPPRWRKTS